MNASTSQNAEAGLQETPKILLVDDNEGILKLLESLFVEKDIAVQTASSAEEAENCLQREDWSFDLVLSDISMPGQSGFDLLEWIKKKAPEGKEVPVLFTTAERPEPEYRIKGLSMGAVDYVVRPIDMTELVIRTIHALEHIRKVRTLQENLENSENLAMVGRLLAAANHEIKNLASIVKLTSERLVAHRTRTGHPDETEQNSLESLREASALLAEVSKQTTTLISPTPNQQVTLNAGSLLDGVSRIMVHRVKHCLLETKKPEDKVYCRGDETKIKQILINLVLNAGEAISEYDPPDGGRITLRMKSENSQCVFEVEDNGIGLNTPETRTEFQAFSSTKKLRGGQGLGLWLCARFAEEMGGSLSLSSEGPGSGTIARLTLPEGDASDITTDDLYESFSDDELAF